MSNPSPDAAAAAPASGVRAAPLRTLVRAAAWLSLAVWTVLLIAWLTLHWGIFPRIEQWRVPIEQRASAVLGVPVRIGAISVRSSGWVPAFELRDVVLLDTAGRPALTLPRVAAALSPRSLLAFEPRFVQLLVEGAEVDLRRDALGRILVAGLDPGGGGGDGAAADWFLRQPEFVLRGGTLRWTDETRLAPPLELRDVQVVFRNGLRQHAIRLDATPDADWGERFTLRGRFAQPLLGRPSDWKRWSGSAYAELPRTDLGALRRHVALPFDLSEGDGALRAWFEVADGRLRGATVDVALRDVALRLATNVEPLVVQRLEGRVVAERDAAGGAVAVRRLAFVTGDGVDWPAADMALRWRQREGQGVEGGELTAQRLDLGAMARVAASLPLGETVHRLLAELAPQGIVTDLRTRWDGTLDAPARYQVQAALGGFTLASLPAATAMAVGRPGVRNAGLRVDANEKGGEAQLTIDDGAIDLPGVFEEPVLPLRQFGARLQWKIQPVPGAAPRVQVTVRDARFANADAEGTLNATWTTGPGAGFARGGRYPGVLELDGRLGRAAAERVPRYLPQHLVAARSYLARAVRGGTVASATFRVRGDLWDFPFHDAKSARAGEFRVAATAQDLTFDYAPGEPRPAGQPAADSPWPAFTRVDGEVVIDRSALEIRNARGRMFGVELGGVRGGIASLLDNPVLRLEGTARGPLSDLLRFVNVSPVGRWTGGALQQASATGNTELKLELAFPLHDLGASTARGSLQLSGSDVRIQPDLPVLAATRARIDFTHRGLTVSGATARLLGGEVAFDGGSAADGRLRFSGGGVATAEAMRRATEWPVVARLGDFATGQAPYRLTLGFVQGRPEVDLTSTLAGMAIDLPAPLRKAADAALPLRVQTSFAPESLAAGQTPRDQLRIELGGVLQAQFQREWGAAGPLVRRGGIGVFDTAPTPASGVGASLNLPLLQLDAWQAAADRLLGADGFADAEADGYRPDRIALRAQRLSVGSRHLDGVTAGVSLDAGLWRGNVDAEQLSGYIEYRPARAGSTAGRVYARLARLALPKTDVEQVESLLAEQPASVPALDIVVDDFELRGKKLGRLEIEAVNRSGDGGREWQLSRLTMATPEARLTATGRWAAAAGTPRRAVMDFKLAVADSGALLDRLGTPRAVRGGKGEFGGQVSWLGSPLSPDYASMSGQVAVAIDSGQFLKADPGAARLLGVLSLQSLPRRLALDFRDVFQEGFAFDNITGDVKIVQGVAQTNNLRMRGLQAAVLMEGSADLARETTDLRVIVVPEINAGTASLAYAAINPAVGLGTFLAQMLLRRPLIAAGTREFHVTGPWEDPRVERIERKPGAPVPEIDPPASAPVEAAPR